MRLGHRAAELFERGVAARREVEDSNRAVQQKQRTVQARSSYRRTGGRRAGDGSSTTGSLGSGFTIPANVVEASSAIPVLRVDQNTESSRSRRIGTARRCIAESKWGHQAIL